MLQQFLTYFLFSTIANGIRKGYTFDGDSFSVTNTILSFIALQHISLRPCTYPFPIKDLAVLRTGHITKISEALWAMMDYYDDDTYTEEDFEEVIGDIETLNSEMAMVELLLEKGNLTAANARLTNMPSVVHFGKGETQEYDAFVTWISLRIDMLNEMRDWSTMNASDITALESLLQNFDTYAASQAMAVLNGYNNADYFIPPAYGSSGLMKRSLLSREEISNHLLEIYPNPADYIVTIKLNQALPTEEFCSLVVTDIMGQVVLSRQINPSVMQYIVDTKDWSNGIYAFRIEVPNSHIELTGKIDVAH